MSKIELAIIACSVIGMLIAILCDWSTRRIPNVLTFSMLILGFLLNFSNHGVNGAWQSFLGLACGILLLYLPFSVGGVGGGDVKLLGALGSLLGPMMVFKIFLASALFGGIFSLVTLIKNKSAKNTLAGIKNRILYFLIMNNLPNEEKWNKAKNKLSIPYAFAIGCGMLAVLLIVNGG